MQDSQVVIGMKATPFQKTVEGFYALEDSVAWRYCQERKQPYLYVVEYDEDGYWILSEDIDGSGDFFNACDFNEYIEQ